MVFTNAIVFIVFRSYTLPLTGTSESPVLRSLKYTEAQSQHCFSVVSSTDKMYDFEASSPEERDKWFRGLFIILKYNTYVNYAVPFMHSCQLLFCVQPSHARPTTCSGPSKSIEASE